MTFPALSRRRKILLIILGVLVVLYGYPVGYTILGGGTPVIVPEPSCPKTSKPDVGVYVINLDRNPDRLAHIMPRVAALNLPLQRVAAVDGKTLTPEHIASVLDNDAFKLIQKQYASLGTLGCYLSHIKVLEQFLASCHSYAFIFEDDADFDPATLRTTLAFVLENAQAWDIVSFNLSHRGMPLTITTNPALSQQRLTVYGTTVAHSGGYLINRTAAQKLLAKAFPIRLPYDHFFTRAWEFGIVFAGVENPRVIHQYPFPSENVGSPPTQQNNEGRKITLTHALFKIQTETLRLLYNAYVWARYHILSTKSTSMSASKNAVSSPFVSVASLRNTKRDQIMPPQKLSFIPFPLASNADSSYAHPRMPAVAMYTIENGRVWGKAGIIVDDENRVVREFLWPWSDLARGRTTHNPAHHVPAHVPAPLLIQGTVLVLAQEGAHNYYHWVSEVLPKLLLVQEKKIPFDKVYVPKLTQPFLRETLHKLGITDDRMIEANDHTTVQATNLLVLSAVARACYTPSWIAERLRKTFLPAITTPTSSPRKIFISRSRGIQRRFLNEEALSNLLTQKGYVTVFLEDLSFDEQVTLFQNANIIVAAHGAGLTNLLWCAPGTQVFELFQEREDDTFWFLSQTLGLQHHCIGTTTFKAPNNPSNPSGDTTLSHDVLETLQKVIP